MRAIYRLIKLGIISWPIIFGAVFADDSFIETFDGNGPYESRDGLYQGLDNPDWFIRGNGQMRDGGYAFRNAPNRDDEESDNVFRLLSDDCSFAERIELREAYQGPIPDFHFPTTVSWFLLWHILSSFPENHLSISLQEIDDNTGLWELGSVAGMTGVGRTVRSGTHISLEIRFDKALSEATFAYDFNLDDDLPAISVGPLPAASGSRETHFFPLAGGHGAVSGILDYWSYTSLCDEPNGDFNGNGVFDSEDIDLLSDVVRLGTHDALYDLTADGLVDELDRTQWVETLRRTYFGDSNLDGEFSSLDLVTVFQAGQYEDAIVGNSTWSTGDWNGDAEFNTRDLVLAFTGGGYEQGPRPSAPSVPEPYALGAYVWIYLSCLFRRRRHHRTR